MTHNNRQRSSLTQVGAWPSRRYITLRISNLLRGENTMDWGTRAARTVVLTLTRMIKFRRQRTGSSHSGVCGGRIPLFGGRKPQGRNIPKVIQVYIMADASCASAKTCINVNRQSVYVRKSDAGCTSAKTYIKVKSAISVRT